MRSRSESVVAALIVALTALLLLAACSKQNPGAISQNVPPETTLSFVSDAGDTTEFRVHLRWGGNDPDGEVVAYLARWDTLDWFAASGTDSVFVLTADDSSDSAASVRRPHVLREVGRRRRQRRPDAGDPDVHREEHVPRYGDRSRPRRCHESRSFVSSGADGTTTVSLWATASGSMPGNRAGGSR